MQEQRTPNNQIRAQDTGGHDPNAGFSHAVGGAETGEDDGGCAAHGAEE
jgi:hypothetical protein